MGRASRGPEESIVAAIGEEARRDGLGSAEAPRWGAIHRLGWSRSRLGLAALTAAAAVIGLIVVLSLPGSGPAPEQFAMVVSGTPLAPQAHGNATLTKHQAGWAIHLSATGLPRLSGSRYYYQAWLKNGAGILVPVGTFNAPQDVSLWSGVPVTQYRTLTVTIQQVGGSPASSGRRVMTGTIESRTP